MDRPWDVIVVGAGPGGAACALLLARAGIRVALLDGKQFPRDKTCGDALGLRTVRLLMQWGLWPQVEAAVHGRAAHLSVSSPDGATFDWTPEALSPRPFPCLYLCRRSTLDALLVDAAVQAGAQLFQHHQVVGMLREGERIVGVRTRDPQDGALRLWRAHVIVGADGAYSAVARLSGWPARRSLAYWALRGYYHSVNHIAGRAELHFIQGMLPGYLWMAAQADRVNVGMIVLASRRWSAMPVFQRAVEDVLHTDPRFRERVRGAERLGPWNGWWLPVDLRGGRLARPGVVLVGDAAGMADPFTGEGIGPAMLGGRLAAETIQEAIRCGDPDAIPPTYNARVRDVLGPERRIALRLLRLSRSAWLLNHVVRRLARRSTLRREFDAMAYLAENAKARFFSTAFLANTL